MPQIDRLTYSHMNCWQIHGADNYMCKEICDKYSGCDKCPIDKAINRLAEYEDTGLSPEEIQRMKEKDGGVKNG